MANLLYHISLIPVRGFIFYVNLDRLRKKLYMESVLIVEQKVSSTYFQVVQVKRNSNATPVIINSVLMNFEFYLHDVSFL